MTEESRVIETEVSVGRTINMGNYESLRMDIRRRVTVPEGTYAHVFEYDLREEMHKELNDLIANEIQDINND